MPAISYLPSLASVLSEVADPRERRVVRQSFSAILVLALVGLISRLHDFATLHHWATRYCRLLKKPLGFTCSRPALANAELRCARLTWAQRMPSTTEVAAWLRAVIAHVRRC